MSDRDEFEDYARDRGFRLGRLDLGDYADPRAQIAWEAWKAGADAKDKRIAKLERTLTAIISAAADPERDA